MNLVVDTSVWSLVLRRPRVEETNRYVRAFRAHIEGGDGVFLIGSILQELLDGIRDKKDFDRLKNLLRPVPLVILGRGTFVAAAELRQRCRSKGIKVGPVDCLIAAACIQEGYPLLTADRDFAHMARYCDLVVLDPT